MRSQITRSIWQRVLVFTVLTFASVSSTLADWRNEVGIFRVGIVTQGSPASYFIKLDPFRRALAQALEIEVEFYPAPNATAIIDAFQSERIEYAILPATAYALTWNVCECVEPLVVPKAYDSTDGYHVVLISGPGGPQSLDALAGKSIGVLSEQSILGSKMPISLLQNEGVEFSETQTEIVSRKTPSEVISAFKENEIDLLLGWSSLTGNPSVGYSRGTLNKLYDAVGVNISQYSVLWKSPQFPHRPHVIRKKLSGEAKQILRSLLYGLSDNDTLAYDVIEPIYGGGFTAARQERFQDIIEYVDQLYKKPALPNDTDDVQEEIEESPEVSNELTSGVKEPTE